MEGQALETGCLDVDEQVNTSKTNGGRKWRIETEGKYTSGTLIEIPAGLTEDKEGESLEWRLHEVDIEETILEWWVGEITELNTNYFVALLEDLSGITSMAEFDFSVVDQHQRGNIQLGAKFVYYVAREDRKDGRRIVSSLIFKPLLIWQDYHEKYVQEILERDFPSNSISA
jgi:hypothetical protein